MLSSEETPDTGVDPLAPVEQVVHWLAGTTWRLSLGLLIGMIAARLMRHRHLHWSWAAIGAVGCVLMRSALASAFSIAAAAALGATAWGRRWHREDVEAGSDLAQIAADRRRPLEVLRSCARALSVRCGAIRLRDGRSGGDLILGRDRSGRAVSIPFSDGSGGVHTLVVGATGSGKTVTQAWIAVRAIERGMAAVVVDPKGDHGMGEHLRRAAQAAGRPFIEWTPGGPSVYNPYARGSETEIADKALAGERFTEPHYLRQAQRYLGHVVRALRRAGLEVSLREIVEHMDPPRLEDLVRRLSEADAEATHAYLDSLTARQQGDLAGIRDRMAILSESDVGPWLDPQTAGAERFDLLDAVRARAVVYFDLESDSRPLLTQMLGAAIVQDLQTTVAALQVRPMPTLVVIDEFSAVAAEQVVRLFGRARSAGFNLLLGTQELADLRLPGRAQLLEQVMGNLSVLVAHRQVVPASAELIASLAGAKGAWRTTRHSDGGTTRVRISEAVLDRHEVVKLGVGWAAVIVLARGGGVSLARIFSADRKR